MMSPDVADADLKRTIDIMLRSEAAPSITATAGQDLPAYADELMARFADPALCHRLAQIAMDGSQKIAQRWLATMAARQERHLDSPAHMAALGAWLRHIHHYHNLDDPAGDRLRTTLRSLPFDLAVMRIFGDGGLVASKWNPDTAALLGAYETSASGRITPTAGISTVLTSMDTLDDRKARGPVDISRLSPAVTSRWPAIFANRRC